MPNVTGGEKSSFNQELNPGSLMCFASTLNTELMRPNILTDSHKPGYWWEPFSKGKWFENTYLMKGKCIRGILDIFLQDHCANFKQTFEWDGIFRSNLTTSQAVRGLISIFHKEVSLLVLAKLGPRYNFVEKIHLDNYTQLCTILLKGDN